MNDPLVTRSAYLRGAWSAGVMAALSGIEAFLVSTGAFRIALIAVGAAAFVISVSTLLKARSAPKTAPRGIEP